MDTYFSAVNSGGNGANGLVIIRVQAKVMAH